MTPTQLRAIATWLAVLAILVFSGIDTYAVGIALCLHFVGFWQGYDLRQAEEEDKAR